MEVFFLVNANRTIGYGHMSRCLLIGEELESRNVLYSFITNSTLDDVIADLRKKRISVNEMENPDSFQAENYIEVIEQIKGRNTQVLLVVDSDDDRLYATEFQKKIIDHDFKLMYITLKSNCHYYANLILNQNIIALSQNYKAEKYAKTLLGPKYFIMNKRLRGIEPNPVKQINNQYNVLISFGNADPNSLTSRILDILNNRKDCFNIIRIVIGGLNSNKREIIEKINEIGDDKIELYVETKNMYELMALSDLLICSAGLTFWEGTLHLIPSLIIAGSEREKEVTRYLCDQNYSFYLGSYDDQDWFNLWSSNIKKGLLEVKNGSVKTKELCQLINVEGVAEVVNEMVSLQKKH